MARRRKGAAPKAESAPSFRRLVAMLPELERGTARDDVLYLVVHEDCLLDFDWLEEAEALAVELARIDRASLEVCRKLLTVMVRRDRFVEGSLQEHIGAGHVAAVVRRIAELTCPECSSARVLEIIYGEPPGPPEEVWGPDVIVGGCLVHPDNPTRQCGACGAQWGRWEDEQDAEADEG